MKNVMLNPYLEGLAFEPASTDSHTHMYNMIQTEQMRCQIFPHFIKTKISYEGVDGSQQMNRIAYEPMTSSTTICTIHSSNEHRDERTYGMNDGTDKNTTGLIVRFGDVQQASL